MFLKAKLFYMYLGLIRPLNIHSQASYPILSISESAVTLYYLQKLSFGFNGQLGIMLLVRQHPHEYVLKCKNVLYLSTFWIDLMEYFFKLNNIDHIKCVVFFV